MAHEVEQSVLDAWGEAAAQEALRQIADLCQKKTVSRGQGRVGRRFIPLCGGRERNRHHLSFREHGDDRLYNVGRHVLQSAWHEDQRLAVTVSTHLSLPHFLHAIEHLYLCLSGELSGLCDAVDDDMLQFFETAYPQQVLRKFLAGLQPLEGGTLNELPRRAADLYRRLSRAFSRFLATEVTWGNPGHQVPLWRPQYVNFFEVR